MSSKIDWLVFEHGGLCHAFDRAGKGWKAQAACGFVFRKGAHKEWWKPFKCRKCVIELLRRDGKLVTKRHRHVPVEMATHSVCKICHRDIMPEICLECGGVGSKLGMTHSSKDCHKCKGTGVGRWYLD